MLDGIPGNPPCVLMAPGGKSTFTLDKWAGNESERLVLLRNAVGSAEPTTLYYGGDSDGFVTMWPGTGPLLLANSLFALQEDHFVRGHYSFGAVAFGRNTSASGGGCGTVDDCWSMYLTVASAGNARVLKLEVPSDDVSWKLRSSFVLSVPTGPLPTPPRAHSHRWVWLLGSCILLLLVAAAWYSPSHGRARPAEIDIRGRFSYPAGHPGTLQHDVGALDRPLIDDGLDSRLARDAVASEFVVIAAEDEGDRPQGLSETDVLSRMWQTGVLKCLMPIAFIFMAQLAPAEGVVQEQLQQLAGGLLLYTYFFGCLKPIQEKINELLLDGTPEFAVEHAEGSSANGAKTAVTVEQLEPVDRLLVCSGEETCAEGNMRVDARRCLNFCAVYAGLTVVLVLSTTTCE